MRFHQSWCRARVLRVPCGTGPGAQDRNRYGNMLTEADAEEGRNFLTPGIFATALRRLRQETGVIEPFRLLGNMLSSQPMCFNLFGPLAEDFGLATQLIGALLGADEVREVTDVLIEWAPQPASEYLDDGTAFDAFIAYARPNNSPAFVGIETKLSDPFSPKRYHKATYDYWVTHPDSPFRRDAKQRLDDPRHNQLWRDHLLAVALHLHPSSRYARGSFLLVRHPADEDCERIVAGYRALLKPGDHTFADLPLDDLIAAWDRAAPDDATRAWLKAFRLRYLDLSASEAEWRVWRESVGG